MDLISKYGQINHHTLKSVYEEFVKETGALSQQQAAQSNDQMWCCINNQLTKQAKSKVLSNSDD